MDNIKKAYSLLADKESKEIFKNRLLYSMSGEGKYVDAMFSYQLERLKEDANVNALIKRVKALIKDEKIIIYGGGHFGNKLIRFINEFFPENCIIGIYDKKFKDRSSYLGYKVLSIENLAKIQNEGIILITPKYKSEEIEAFLLSNGISNNLLFVHKDNDMKEFAKLDTYNQYYDKVVTFAAEEVFIDGGALAAENSFEFSRNCPNYKEIIAFEPDEKNYKRCVEIGSVLDGFKALNYGLWSQRETLFFSSANGSSRISESGDCKVEVDSLDNILGEQRVSFIKMDIEGAEYSALKGAEKCIKRWSPKLAICIYHEVDDFIRIPLLVNELDKEYKLYIRHYSIYPSETVLYAVKE